MGIRPLNPLQEMGVSKMVFTFLGIKSFILIILLVFFLLSFASFLLCERDRDKVGMFLGFLAMVALAIPIHWVILFSPL